MPEKELTILDVGHGNCTLLSDERGIVLIDAGPGSTLLEFLKQEEIARIDVVLISHADKDHIEGLIAVLDSNIVEIGIVRLNADASKGSKLWNILASCLDDFHKKGTLDFDVGLTTRNSGEFNQGQVNIEILAPNLYLATKSAGSTDKKDRPLTPNSNSVVIRLILEGKPIVLLSADIDSVGFDNLLEDGVECRAPIAIFPHHGGHPGSGEAVRFTEEFCNQTKPSFLIFSLGRGVHGTPRPEIVKAVRRVLPDVRIACTQLSKHCSEDIPDLDQNHLSAKFAKGRRKKHCCAGTITINLENIEDSLLPFLDSHKEFIEKAIPKALCAIKVEAS